jgi:TolA-binding protein
LVLILLSIFSETPSTASEAARPSGRLLDSALASISTASRSRSTTRASPTPHVDETEAEQLARLEAEIEELRREQRIVSLQRQIDSIRNREGAASTSTSTRKIKAEPFDDEKALKRLRQEIGEVKEEIGEASLPKPKEDGKEKGETEVIVLDDSD